VIFDLISLRAILFIFIASTVGPLLRFYPSAHRKGLLSIRANGLVNINKALYNFRNDKEKFTDKKSFFMYFYHSIQKQLA
jgi:hypothetical protein